MIYQIAWDSLDAAKAHPDFGDGGWLTFYLMGQPENHPSTWPEFRKLGAVNLEGEVSGFVYAKFPVSLDKQDIEKVVERVWAHSAEAELDCSIIDLDASADVERSKFFTLWTAS